MSFRCHVFIVLWYNINYYNYCYCLSFAAAACVSLLYRSVVCSLYALLVHEIAEVMLFLLFASFARLSSRHI